jgi:cytochrome P450
MNTLDIDLEAMMSDPYPTFAELRADEQWRWSDQLKMWLVSRYDDVVFVDENPDIFSLQVPNNLMTRTVGTAMVRLDGAAHQRIRTASGEPLKRRAVQRDWKKVITDLVEELVSPLRTRTSAELMTDVASPLTGACLREVIGLLDATPADIERWSGAFIAGLINNSDDPQVWANARLASDEVRASVESNLIRVRKDPDASVISSMADAHPADALSVEEISSNIRLMIAGGFNDARDALATLPWLLMKHPDARDRVFNDPKAFERAIDESVRWLTPIGSYPRVLAQDYSSPSADLKAGDRVLVIAASANHDDTKFPDPGRFDIDRPNLDEHLGFSVGAHYCLGNHLVRGMMRVLTPALLELPGIAPAADPEFTGWQFRAPVSVPVILDPTQNEQVS